MPDQQPNRTGALSSESCSFPPEIAGDSPPVMELSVPQPLLFIAKLVPKNNKVHISSGELTVKDSWNLAFAG